MSVDYIVDKHQGVNLVWGNPATWQLGLFVLRTQYALHTTIVSPISINVVSSPQISPAASEACFHHLGGSLTSS